MNNNNIDTDRSSNYSHFYTNDSKIFIDRPIYYSRDFLSEKFNKSLSKNYDESSRNSLNKFDNDSCSNFETGIVFKKKFSLFVIDSLHNFNFSSTILYLFPIIGWLPKSLKGKDLLADFITGMTMLAMQIPQGLAYARLAGVEPVNGLSVSLFCPFLYSLFGGSRHISVGTYAVVSIVCRGILEKLGDLHNLVDTDEDISNATLYLQPFTSTENRVAPIDILCSLALFMGLIQVNF